MAINTFLCYAQEDERMARQLKKHLSMLRRVGLITLWDHSNIPPGAEWKKVVKNQLDEAQIILLLISASFLDSNYHYELELLPAIYRHERGEASVIPVILSHVRWEILPLDKLQAQVLPQPPEPLTDWLPPDKGFKSVVIGIEKVIEQLNTQSLPGPIAEREKFMEGMDKLIAAIEAQMRPPGRANAVAQTLQELSGWTPLEVTLADIVVGWRIVAQPLQTGEDGATTQRRATCGELAALATPLLQEEGTIAGALKAWQTWQEASTKSNGPRAKAMAQTFARELSELQASVH